MKGKNIWCTFFVVFLAIVMSINISLFNGTASAETIDFSENFEAGYDGWLHYDGSVSEYGSQTNIVYRDSYAFKMTGFIDSNGAYSGNFQHLLNIAVLPSTQFSFAYRFPSKDVSYVGYYLEFNNGKLGYYISLFSGSFINISQTYLLQYRNEASNTWHTHTANIYDNYKTAFGTIPAGLRITGIYMMMGDPYYTGSTQTAYFDEITITSGAPLPPSGGVWEFNEGSGTTVHDSSGNNHHGIVQGAKWVPGLSGSALDFDGINDKVDLPDDEFKLQEFTVSCWVNFKNCGTKPIFCVSNTALYGGWNLGLIDDSHFRLLTGNIDGAIIDEAQTSTSVSSGVWYHVVGVKTLSSLRIYLNGVLSGQDTTVSPVVYTNCVYGDVFYPFIAHGGVQNDLYYYKG
ncbi:MAG: DUF3047 domain-containing protein, partial [Candidatus Thermoplasmatota archaeon]|nr:DUF3047 domain-containing protein [Candidatus Thermoplasmatota archaeon]